MKRAGREDAFEIASAATSGEEIWNGIGNPVYPPAKRILAEHGIRCDGKRARRMTRGDYDYYDRIICMDRANVRNAERIAVFRALCAETGRPCHVFPGHRGESREDRLLRLHAWVAQLPRHCAIFAANDNAAGDVADALIKRLPKA